MYVNPCTLMHVVCLRCACDLMCVTCDVSAVCNASLPYTVILIFFSGSPAAINGSLLPAFFVSLYGIKYPPTVTPTPSRPSLVEEYIWWIVGAMGGATLALILILLILLVTYSIVRHKRQVGLLLQLLCFNVWDQPSEQTGCLVLSW